MTLAMAIELESTGIKVNAVSPGFTKTNLNGYAGTETVEEGTREAVRVALLGPDGPTGRSRTQNSEGSRGDWASHPALSFLSHRERGDPDSRKRNGAC